MYRNLGLVGPVQQKIKLPSPNHNADFEVALLD